VTYDCCEHCEHDTDDGAPHDEPCEHGCNDQEEGR
jgi:hypothetical protein